MVSKFNEQTKVFTDLLRQTDNIKLADELLTPQPLKMKSSENRSRPVKLWQTNGKEYNLYQESSIKVNLDVDKESNKRQKKEMPIWLAKSTVVNEDPTDIDITNPAKQETAKITVLKDDYISQLIQVNYFNYQRRQWLTSFKSRNFNVHAYILISIKIYSF